MKPTNKKLTFIFIILLVFSVFAFGQKTELEKGIELYKQEKYDDAARIFKNISKTNKNDAEVWNYLGLDYFNNEEYKDARKAFIKAVKLSSQKSSYRVNLAYAYLYSNKRKNAKEEINKAIELDPKNIDAYILHATNSLWEGKYAETISDSDYIIALDKNNSTAYLLKADALLNSFGRKWREEGDPKKNLDILQTAAKTLENCNKDCRNSNNSNSFETKQSVIKGFQDHFNRQNKEDSDLSNTDNNRVPLLIINKAPPSYTQAAREANYQGSITLAILFAADGKTKYVIALNTLDYGLTDQAIKAASFITFEPEMLDGKPVSVVRRVQYSFSIY
jgi:Tfp pilus assembly protein PilF